MDKVYEAASSSIRLNCSATIMLQETRNYLSADKILEGCMFLE